MVVVIPIEKSTAESSAMLYGAESFRKLGAVFQGLELCFGVRIIVGDVGT